MTKAKWPRCEALERRDRCRKPAARKAVLGGGQVIVYSCMKNHLQWAHLEDRWEVLMPKDWDKEPRSTQEKKEQA